MATYTVSLDAWIIGDFAAADEGAAIDAAIANQLEHCAAEDVNADTAAYDAVEVAALYELSADIDANGGTYTWDELVAEHTRIVDMDGGGETDLRELADGRVVLASWSGDGEPVVVGHAITAEE
jgi:hypothetical protein